MNQRMKQYWSTSNDVSVATCKELYDVSDAQEAFDCVIVYYKTIDWPMGEVGPLSIDYGFPNFETN